MSEIEPFVIASVRVREIIHNDSESLIGLDLTVVTNLPKDRDQEVIGRIARDIEEETGGQVIFDAGEIEQLMEKRPKVYGFSNWKGSNWDPEGSLARKSPPPSFEKPELN